MKTVIQKAIDNLRESPSVSYTNESIARWLEGLLPEEKTQITEAYIDGTLENIKENSSGESYYTKKYPLNIKK